MLGFIRSGQRTPRAWRRLTGAVLSAVCVAGVSMTGFSPVTAASARTTAATATRSATVQIAAAGTANSAQLSAEFGAGWWKSKDFIITSSGDAKGMHYYIARENEGYYWRPLASILPAHADAGSWTGYFCVSGDNRYVLATVAPTMSGNYPDLEDRGALAYVIDIASGQVHPLVAGVAMYYDVPGCGTSDTAVLTSFPGQNESRTDLVTVNLASARPVRQQIMSGQYTSAVPLGGEIAAYRSGAIESVSPTGAVRRLAAVHGVAYQLAPSAAGRLDYLTTTGGSAAAAWQLSGTTATQIGTGDRQSMLLRPGGGGHNILTGATQDTPAMHADVRAAGLATATPSTPAAGLAAGASRLGSVTETLQTAGPGPARLQPVPVLTSTVTTQTVQRPLPPPAAAATALPDALNGAAPRTNAPLANTSSPVCAVPRLNTQRQVLQPDHQQVEWAVDQAVAGDLTIQRPANFDNTGLAAYRPDQDIPRPALTGGGTIPPQILLGVLAQESNFWQASWHALPGVAGDPLVADYYGAGYNNIDTINYDNADCGYGVGQITTGMTLASASYWGNGNATVGAQIQAKIAVDYTENTAAAVSLLSHWWNTLAGYSPAILANGGNSSYTSNWYMALWAYNSGLNPQASTGNTSGCTPGPSCTDGSGNWGLGWTNNPENTDWLPSRHPFLYGDTYADAATPQDWPYQEKVLGWSAIPLLDYTGSSSYTGTGAYPSIAPFQTFCTSADSCSLTSSTYCTLSNYHCWWHQPVSWITCGQTTSCVKGSSTYAPGNETEPADPDPHPADCNSSLPSKAVIVDDEPADYNVVGCNRSTENWSSKGTFTLTQGANSAGVPISLVDTHQLGAGFGGHLWFTHNIVSTDTEHLVTGTWGVSLPSGAYHVLVHIPDTGGTTTSADYQVRTSSGTIYSAVVDQYQQQNQWIGIGYYGLGSNAQVTLNNVTQDRGVEAHDVAYDAVAFVPAAGTVVNHQFNAVSLFDWNQNLNTTSPSFINSPARNETTLHDWAIDYGYKGPLWSNPSSGTVYGVSSYPKCASASQFTSSCVPPDVWNVGNTWATNAQQAGTAPSTSTTPVMTEPVWLGFSNTTPGPTTMNSSTWADDGSYKIKTELDVSFVVSNGTIVAGSQQVTALVRTGDTHLPEFVSGFMNAVKQDYGIATPNLNYNEVDANTYTSDATPVTPLSTGHLPGRALVWHADTPALTNSGTCVAERAISGGEIGWRPVVAQSTVAASVEAWISALQNDSAVNPSVVAMAQQIFDFFYNDSGTAPSLFAQAPPIWQEAHLQVCANGSISSTAEEPNASDSPALTLVDQSLMPDLYLYYDGKLVTNTGAAATKPVQRGDFASFSNVLQPGGYYSCETGKTGNAGNPWTLSPGAPADAIPLTGNFCDNPGEDFGSPYPGG